MTATAAGYEYTGFLIFIKMLGLCSMAGSSFILRDVFHRMRRVSASTVNRSWRHKITLTQSVLFCLSVGDFFAAFFVQFLSTWMVPSNMEVSLASGTVATCTAQGYLGALFYSLSAGSNASLAVAYSLIVKFGWRDDDQDRYRWPFTAIPIVIAVALSVAPLPDHNYNYNGAFFCDITASPLGCNYPDSTVECTRGLNARSMLLGIIIIPFTVAFAIIIGAVVLLIYSVLKQERRMDRYQREGMPLNRSMTTKTTRQGLYYIGAFGLAWVPWFIYAIMEYNFMNIPEALSIVHLTTKALQGVFNSSVYFRPKYKTERANNPEASRVSSLLKVLRISIPPVKCCAAESEPVSNATKGGTDEEKNVGNNASKKSANGHADEENANNPQETPEEKRKDTSNGKASNEVGTEETGGEKKSVRISDAA